MTKKKDVTPAVKKDVETPAVSLEVTHEAATEKVSVEPAPAPAAPSPVEADPGVSCTACVGSGLNPVTKALCDTCHGTPQH